MTDTIYALAAEFGFKLKSYRAGQTENGIICPACGGGKTKEKSLNVTIDPDGLGLTFNCHRGSCGNHGGKRLSARLQGGLSTNRSPSTTPKPHAIQDRPIELYDWFSKRGISWDTVDLFGVYLLPGYKFGNQGLDDAIVFPYTYGGNLVNRKYRGMNNKTLMMQDFNAIPTIFNIDAISEPDVVLWVEGEPDVMAMHESGYPQTVSLKDGAPAQLKAGNDPTRETDKRFEAIKTHHELLLKVKKFILAGDMDEPGIVLREELARRFGRHRCWIVTWPGDCKDANDTLVKYGAETVRECVENAEPYPLEGIQRVNIERLMQYIKLPPIPVMGTGVATVDQAIHLPTEGRLIVVTGMPNAGKSTVILNWMVNTMRMHNRKWLVFSPEMQPVDEFIIQCLQILAGKRISQMSTEERLAGAKWLETRLFFLASDSEDDPPTLDMILDRARSCVMRFGVTDTLIDPINELEQARGGMTETEYIGRMLQRSRSFSQRHGCNTWIVAHPAKMRASKPGEAIPPPGPYDISGSSHYANKADLGITVHTPNDVTLIMLWKSRFSRWGRKGAQAEMEYDKETCRYFASEVSSSSFSRQIQMGEL